LEASYGTYCNGAVSTCTLGDNIGALVRLAFNDAIGAGGANGCVDFLHTSGNNGLQSVVATLDSVYYGNSYDSIISKADLYVLAANTAIEYATTQPTSRRMLSADMSAQEVTAQAVPIPTRAPTTFASTLDTVPYTLSLPFRYGRVDSYSCNDVLHIPTAHFTWSETYKMFSSVFGMNIKEVVAIMGAHSVGRCQWANSGYEGGHTASQSSLSNEFYKTFTKSTYRNQNHSAVWVSDSSQVQIALMADTEMLFNTNANGWGSCGQYNSFTASTACPLQGPSSAAFIAYANSISQWFGNFTTAWQKMTEVGFADVLKDVDYPTSAIYPYLNGTLPPSAVPTTMPTIANTANPTISQQPTFPRPPTVSPTANPSALPTAFPSPSPSASPSDTPTASPTAFPSDVPTFTPSSTPTFIPSAVPSEMLTDGPTFSPSTGNVASSPSPAPSVVASSASPTSVPSEATSSPSANDIVPTASPTSILPIDFTAYQTLLGIDAATWNSDSNILLSFQESVAAACGHDIDSSDVVVNGIISDVSSASRSTTMALRSNKKHVLTSSIVVAYTLSGTFHAVAGEDAMTVLDDLVESVNDGDFSGYLKSFGQLNSVTTMANGDVTAPPNSLSFVLVTDDDTYPTPSLTPSFAPSFAPSSAAFAPSVAPTVSSGAAQAAAGTAHSRTLSTTSIVIIVVVPVVSFIALAAYCCISRALSYWTSVPTEHTNGADAESTGM
jgi:hypothetical protein